MGSDWRAEQGREGNRSLFCTARTGAKLCGTCTKVLARQAGEGLWGEISTPRSSSTSVFPQPVFSNKVATKVVTPQDWQGWLQWACGGITHMLCWPHILVSRHLTARGTANPSDQWLIYSCLPSPADTRTGCFRGIAIKSLSKIAYFKKRPLVQAEIGFCSEAWGLWKLVFLFDFPVVNNYRFDILRL